MVDVVAVYGSLREGLHNHVVLGHSEKVGDGKLEGFGMYTLGAFPVLSGVGRITEVVVEVYKVTPKTMLRLDMLEGYPHFYTRSIVDVIVGGKVVKAWVYHIDDEFNEEDFVKSGDWVKYYATT